MSVIEQWNEIQSLLKNESDISNMSYKTFLETLEPIKVSNNLVIIKADNDLERNYIEKKYSKIIMIAINEVTGKSYDIKFIIPKEIGSINEMIEYENKTAVSRSSMIGTTSKHNNLNSRYTFDTFVVGNNNKLAHAASLAVADSPAEAYNPLFIYGGVGLGKTHLMHSIAHNILNESPHSKVLYVSSEKFTNELINSIKTGNNEDFRKKYRDIDVLLVDDIQFIAGKERTQEEFFHTFNTLYEAKKQLIISSDRPPKEIETLEERLRSRFEWGLIADIQAPDFETRMAILRKKAELENLDIPNDVNQYVANNITSNIRELEGAVNKIVAYSTLVHKQITKELAEDALKDLISLKENPAITIEYIVEVVSQHYNLNPEDITSKKRPREISYPRQIVMYLSRTLTDMSLPQIGNKLGKRDHTTIIHGYEKINTELKTDPILVNTISILTKKVTGK
ncbi:MAG: chromosomal replication initiator protein DnaA [Firmicutes bacterium HGW-Firmicutes-7]|nr:MAG: chromosomal replication initiator protein DnaA [Firmicutes bacterium HGW-Firmicutes-7]